jgi:hypothetical protein
MSRSRRRDRTPDAHLFPTRPYDLVKEFVVAVVVIGVLTVVLAAVFSSPDRKAITLADWAKAAPADVVATATAELAGTESAARRAPAPRQRGSKLGPYRCKSGVGPHPGRRANDLVISPRWAVGGDAVLAGVARLRQPAQSTMKWAGAYSDALAAAPTGTRPRSSQKRLWPRSHASHSVP